MGSPTYWFLSILFGSIGMGYFIFGRRQRRYVALGAGVVLGVFPYFVTNPILMVVIGLATMAVPYFFRE